MSAARKTEQLSIVEARKELTRLPEKLEAELATVAVTRHGKPVMAIMAWEDYEAIVETLEVLSDESALSQLRQSIKEVKAGKTIPWKQARARLKAVG